MHTVRSWSPAQKAYQTDCGHRQGYGRGRAIHKSDGGLTMVSFWVVKNTGQNDIVLEKSQKGNSQSNGAADNAGRQEGCFVPGKMRVEELVRRIDHRHVSAR